jgi:hypothetical protein
MTKEEITLANWHFEKMKATQKYFEYADLSQNILEQQKDDDLLLLQDWLTGVHNKLALQDIRRKELLSLIQSTWRIDKYCGGLETICKASTVRVFTLMKKIEDLESQVKIANLQNIQDKANYKLEINKLGKEIEFLTKNS